MLLIDRIASKRAAVPSPRSHRSTAWHLVRHYLEMIVAMLIGMVLLGLLQQLAWPSLNFHSAVGVLVMATDMAIGMGAWMRVRGHSWRGIAEMSASMYAPFIALLVPYWTGAVSGAELLAWGHLLMFPAMALVMYLRPAEYLH
jgi:flagellar biosynthetic protein FliP